LEEEKLANLNQIYLLGNLTRDPELRYTNEGMAITEMGMAVSKRWKDTNGDENSVVDFFNITVWNHLAENCAGSLKKGDRIIVGGHLNLRSWENKDGKKYNIVNITADVAALSLEFNKTNNHESRMNGANSSIAPGKKNNGESRQKATNSRENPVDNMDIYESSEDKTGNDTGGPDEKIKKKGIREKRQESISSAADLAAGYSLEVIGT
jgi:single-strand DNA-binding protein